MKYVIGYIVSGFPFLRSLVHMYICTSIHLSFHHILGTRVKVLTLKSINTLHYEDPLMNFIYIWHDGRYRSKVLLSVISTPGPGLEVKVMDFEFSYESQNVC